MLLKVLSLILIIVGVMTIYTSRYIVKKYGLDKKVTADEEEEMDRDELEKYKFSKAQLNVKMLGMLISLPGLIIFIMVFR